LIHYCIFLDFSLRILLWCTDPRTSSFQYVGINYCFGVYNFWSGFL